jgi:hypothetical protein
MCRFFKYQIFVPPFQVLFSKEFQLYESLVKGSHTVILELHTGCG